MKIYIDGELEDVSRVYDGDYLPLLSLGQRDYYVAEDSEAAGAAARRYWQEMAESDPKEFICLIGEERLMDWALGRGDSFGFSSLEDLLDAAESAPEEIFARYDGSERECSVEMRDEDLVRLDELELEQQTTGEPLPEGEQDELDELRALGEELEETRDELGFAPTVAYRHN